MKVSFDTIWEVKNNKLTNKVAIRVNGMTAYPRALSEYEGMFGGINWSYFIGREIDIKQDDDVFVILGIY